MQANSPSRARSYFDQIGLSANGVKFLNGLVGSETPTFESEFLDFKGGFNLDLKSEDLQDLWAKNLSCFANSDGGVLIFGIEAPKGKAKNLSLVQDVEGLVQRLKSLLPVATEPPVQRVEIEPYRDPPESNKGFVVCFIPASPWRPHQVKLGSRQNWFYIRATDNCIPCNHSTLRSLFSPQFVSVIEINYQTTLRSNVVSRRQDVLLHCWLDNKGPATASDAFVLYDCLNLSTDPNYNHTIWHETDTANRGVALCCLRSIHPNERLKIFSVQLGSVNSSGVKDFKNEKFVIRISVSAHNQAPSLFEFTVWAKDIDDSSVKKAALSEN